MKSTANATSIAFEVEPFVATVMKNIHENIDIVVQFNLESDREDVFVILCEYTFAADDLFYQQQHFQAAKSRIYHELITLDFHKTHKWSEIERPLVEGKSALAKQKRAETVAFNATHKIRQLSVTCRMLDRFRSQRASIVASLTKKIVPFLAQAVVHYDLHTKQNNCDFMLRYNLRWLSGWTDEVFSASFKYKRKYDLPTYVIDVIRNALTTHPDVAPFLVSFSVDRGVLMLQTNLFMGNRYKRVKKEGLPVLAAGLQSSLSQPEDDRETLNKNGKDESE